MENIFKEACLLRLSISTWAGLKQLDPSVMERIGESEWLKGRKVLIDHEYLAPVKTTAGKARCMIKKQALPFPISGLNLVPKEQISAIENQLQDLRHEFNANVRMFMRNYATARSEAREALGDLFDPLDYPIDPADRFSFHWQYVNLAMPGNSQLLSPILYEREREKFLNLMEETRDQAIAALRIEFAELVSHLTDRLGTNGDSKPKILRSSVLQKLNEFLDNFSNRNLFEDEELHSLVGFTRDIITGVDTEILRDNQALRESIRQDMAGVKSEIDRAVMDLPRRRIYMEAA